MTKVSIESAASRLPSLVEEVKTGEEVVLTENNRPVVRLVPITSDTSEHGSRAAKPKFGSGRGLILYMSPDFDAPLDDFEDYMP
jgi:prevent-host-death family protein